VLVTHSDPGERDFITATLQGWGIRTEAAPDGVDALARGRTGELRALVVDAATIAADREEWAALREDAHPVPMLVVAPPGEGDPLVPCGQHATAVLASPLQLRAVRAAILEVSKEYV
jgi:DNA-binding response OmpR family regulator